MIGIEFIPNEFESDVALLKELRAFLPFDFVLIPDNPAFGVKISPIISAKMLQDALSLPFVACISGSGKSIEVAKSLLLGAKYASLKGVACVSGDREGISSIEILKNAQGFEYLISSTTRLEEKKALGLTHCITQPLYENFPTFSFPTLLNFMPIFSPQTFSSLQSSKLGFEIPQSYQLSKDLVQSNFEIYSQIKNKDFYLTPLNLKRQMSHLKSLFSHS